MSTGMRGQRLALLAIVAALAVAVLAPARVAAAEYTMVTRAGYLVDDAAGHVAVTVEIDFTEPQQLLHDALLKVQAEIFADLHGSQNVKFMMTTIRRQAASCLFGLAPFIEDILSRYVSEEELSEVDGDEYCRRSPEGCDQPTCTAPLHDLSTLRLRRRRHVGKRGDEARGAYPSRAGSDWECPDGALAELCDECDAQG